MPPEVQAAKPSAPVPSKPAAAPASPPKKGGPSGGGPPAGPGAPPRLSGVRWWAWGEISRRFPRSRAERVKEFLRHELGVPLPGAGGPAIDLESLRIPPSRLTAAEVQQLKALVPEGTVSDSKEERLLHSFGRSYVDLVAARKGLIKSATDLVVHPGSVGEVEDVLRYAAAHDLAVVPWGGGTSVVGGVDPVQGPHRAVLTLSLSRLIDPQGIDSVSHLAKFQCGIHGPELERHLNAKGLTLGHFPQSFEFSTLGGWLATRSSGQASSGYGEVVERLRGATVVTPVGTYRWERGVCESSGPDPSDLFPGSEGTLGVFVEATVEVDALPERTSYHGALFPDWSSGLQAARELSQGPFPPVVMRVSDPFETILTMEGRPPAQTVGERMRERLEPSYLGLRKLEEGSMCLGIIGYEGSAVEVHQGDLRRRAVLHDSGALDLGGRVGETWKRERFLLPYLRDDLLEDGWLVETLETGACWSDVDGVTNQVRAALQQAARRGKFPLFCGAHLSHTSTTGSGIYFTLVAPQSPRDPVGQWLSLKEAATEALLHSGGVLSHHHGVGRMHRPWVASYRKSLGGMTLRAAKGSLDPMDVLNPGKTLPEAPPERPAKAAAPPASTPAPSAAPPAPSKSSKETKTPAPTPAATKDKGPDAARPSPTPPPAGDASR